MKTLLTLPASLILLIQSVQAQSSILDVINHYPDLTNFRDVLNSSTAFSSIIASNLSNFTLLAPNNAAIDAWLPTLPPNVSSADIADILRYHLLYGNWPTLNIGRDPLPVRTWLTDNKWTNVTDGQRVEVFRNEDGVFFESGNKITSHVVMGDLAGSNGSIHIIDRVLTFPTTLAVTAASTHLSYLAAGMIPGSYLQPTNFSVDISTRPNTTIFGPNSVSAVLDIPLNASQSFYSNLFEYHCISKLVYSSELVNGTVLPTFNGKNITIRVDGEGGLWANNARVIGKDYLLSNGVLHVLDGIMDPNYNTTASAPHTPSPQTGPSLAMQAGIGVGIGAVSCIVFAAAIFIFWRQRRSKTRTSQGKLDSNVEDSSADAVEMQDHPCPRHENGIEVPGDLGRIWQQEPKTLLGMGGANGLEPKSLWVQRQMTLVRS